MNTECEDEIKKSAKRHARDILACMFLIDMIAGFLLIIFIATRVIEYFF